jgi:hypothetical protein
MKPSENDAKTLREYLDLRPVHGSVWMMEDHYLIKVHNSVGRWIFSGELVNEWNGVKVVYDFDTKPFEAA